MSYSLENERRKQDPAIEALIARIDGAYRSVRDEQSFYAEHLKRIERAGLIMVIDPEKAFEDLPKTAEKARIAVERGMEVIFVGGSTGKDEAGKVVSAVKATLESSQVTPLLIGFPGSSEQVVPGLDACLLLYLPQIFDVFRTDQRRRDYFAREYFRIIEKCSKLNLPLIPLKYILFSAGEPTSVEMVTGIKGINVCGDDHIERGSVRVTPWCQEGDLVFLELGSGAEPVNLGPIAETVYSLTKVMPIVSGGIKTPDNVRAITENLPFPLGLGTLGEEARSEDFGELLEGLSEAHSRNSAVS